MHEMVGKKPRTREWRGLAAWLASGAAKFKEQLFIIPPITFVVVARVLSCRRLCRLVGLRSRRTQNNLAVDGQRLQQDVVSIAIVVPENLIRTDSSNEAESAHHST